MRVSSALLKIIALSISYATANASEVQFDTEDAHVIVVRPVDLWSGDTNHLDLSMKSIRIREVSYEAYDGSGNYLRGGPLLFQSMSDNPITNGVKEELKKLNTSLTTENCYYFKVQNAVAVEPADFANFMKVQEQLYKKVVISQGNPSELQKHVDRMRFIGGVLSFTSVAISMDKFGSLLGAQASMGSGISDDIYRTAFKSRAGLAPIVLNDFDPSEYKQIDVRRVDYLPEITGQIIIAYKKEKTPEAEKAALIKAIVTTTGADTTPEEVEKSRAQDFEARQKIWDQCVADGKCENKK